MKEERKTMKKRRAWVCVNADFLLCSVDKMIVEKNKQKKGLFMLKQLHVALIPHYRTLQHHILYHLLPVALHSWCKRQLVDLHSRT